MKETFDKRLKQAMIIRNVKQVDLVNKTKIGKSSISQYISGEYKPKQKNIFKLATALNVSEAWLMGYDVPMERIDIDIFSNKERELLDSFNKLNDLGKNEAVKRVDELTLIDTYTKNEIENKVKKIPFRLKDHLTEHGNIETIAAHNDHTNEPGEIEKIMEDIEDMKNW